MEDAVSISLSLSSSRLPQKPLWQSCQFCRSHRVHRPLSLLLLMKVNNPTVSVIRLPSFNNLLLHWMKYFIFLFLRGKLRKNNLWTQYGANPMDFKIHSLCHYFSPTRPPPLLEFLSTFPLSLHFKAARFKIIKYCKRHEILFMFGESRAFHIFIVSELQECLQRQRGE